LQKIPLKEASTVIVQILYKVLEDGEQRDKYERMNT